MKGRGYFLMKKRSNIILLKGLILGTAFFFNPVAATAQENGEDMIRIQAEDYTKITGNVTIRENGEDFPIKGGDNEDTEKTTTMYLEDAENGQFLDFSDPITDISSYEHTIPEGQDSASWKVNVSKTGVYKLTFSYNNPATAWDGHRNARDERNCRIVINNEDNLLSDDGWVGWMIFNVSGYNDPTYDQSILQEPSTVTGNKVWNENYMNVYLEEGENTISLAIQAPPGQAVFDGPNLDYIDLEYLQEDFVSEEEIPYLTADHSFKHPGIFYTRADLERIKANKEDLTTVEGKGYQEILESAHSSAEYQPNPVQKIDVGPYNNPNIGGTEFTNDGNAAHYNILRWYMDGEVENAKTAIKILNEWASTLTEVTDGNDLKLRFSLVGPDFVNTAEILKNIYNNDPTINEEDKWQEEDIAKFDSFLKNHLLEKTSSFYPQANGNWDALIGAFNMASAVYLEDIDLFNKSLRQFYLGNVTGGNVSSMGALPNYVYSSGESQESSRDQTHARMGISGLAYQSEVAWNQGLDIYGAYEDRLLMGTLYSASYVTNHSVESNTFISDKNRNQADISSMVYEIVGNHYKNETQTDQELDVIDQAAATTLREVTTVNEGKQKASYFGAMLFSTTPPESVKLNYTGIKTIKKGKKLELIPEISPIGANSSNIQWSFSKDGIVEIDETNRLKAKSVGITKVTATTTNNKTASVTIRVTK